MTWDRVSLSALSSHPRPALVSCHTVLSEQLTSTGQAQYDKAGSELVSDAHRMKCEGQKDKTIRLAQLCWSGTMRVPIEATSRPFHALGTRMA